MKKNLLILYSFYKYKNSIQFLKIYRTSFSVWVFNQQSKQKTVIKSPDQCKVSKLIFLHVPKVILKVSLAGQQRNKLLISPQTNLRFFSLCKLICDLSRVKFNNSEMRLAELVSFVEVQNPSWSPLVQIDNRSERELRYVPEVLSRSFLDLCACPSFASIHKTCVSGTLQSGSPLTRSALPASEDGRSTPGLLAQTVDQLDGLSSGKQRGRLARTFSSVCENFQFFSF